MQRNSIERKNFLISKILLIVILLRFEKLVTTNPFLFIYLFFFRGKTSLRKTPAVFHHPPDTCEKLRSPGKPTYLAAVFFSLASRSRGGEKKKGGVRGEGKKKKTRRFINKPAIGTESASYWIMHSSTTDWYNVAFAHGRKKWLNEWSTLLWLINQWNRSAGLAISQVPKIFITPSVYNIKNTSVVLN